MDLSTHAIGTGLHTAWAGHEVAYLETVDSTNKLARQLAAQGVPNGTLVIADTQSGGRGRRGRSWISPAGEGVFMSLILRPDVHPSKIAKLSLLTALAVAQAIERETGLDAKIKWPNDIVIAGRKVCGLLLEMSASEERLDYVVAGVGINVHQRQFDEEIAHTASSLDLLGKRIYDRAAIVRAFLEAFEQAMEMDEDAMMQAYCARSATIGERVQVIGLTGTFTGTAQSVTESGSLLVTDDAGERHEVLAADVSVRGIMGYV